jgi:hypothetical protein
MSAETITDLDDILVFICRPEPRGPPLIGRVVRRATAATLWPHYVNAAGIIPEGPTTPLSEDDEVFTIYKASSLFIPAGLIRTLLGLHAQELDYERLDQYAVVEGYGDWVRMVIAARREAAPFLTLTL